MTVKKLLLPEEPKVILPEDDKRLITDPKQLRMTVDPTPEVVDMVNAKPKLPRFSHTKRLREVCEAAVAYEQATGDKTLSHALGEALAFAESVESPQVTLCLAGCGATIPKGSSYCSYYCSEKDGATT